MDPQKTSHSQKGFIPPFFIKMDLMAPLISTTNCFHFEFPLYSYSPWSITSSLEGIGSKETTRC